MIPFIVQLVACAALIAAAWVWLIGRKARIGAHRFLYPYIVVAFLAGVFLAYDAWMDFFVAWYSGAQYQAEGQFGLSIEQYAIACSILWVLPGFGLIPFIGTRAFVMIYLACAASIPTASALFLLW